MTRRNDTLAGAAAARSAYVANHAAESRAAIHCNQFDKKIEQLPFPQRSHYSCTGTASNGAGPRTGAHTRASPAAQGPLFAQKCRRSARKQCMGFCPLLSRSLEHTCRSREGVVVVGVSSSSRSSPQSWQCQAREHTRGESRLRRRGCRCVGVCHRRRVYAAPWTTTIGTCFYTIIVAFSS